MKRNVTFGVFSPKRNVTFFPFLYRNLERTGTSVKKVKRPSLLVRNPHSASILSASTSSFMRHYAASANGLVILQNILFHSM